MYDPKTLERLACVDPDHAPAPSDVLIAAVDPDRDPRKGELGWFEFGGGFATWPPEDYVCAFIKGALNWR